jgi:hypothetical protein
MLIKKITTIKKIMKKNYWFKIHRSLLIKIIMRNSMKEYRIKSYKTKNLKLCIGKMMMIYLWLGVFKATNLLEAKAVVEVKERKLKKNNRNLIAFLKISMILSANRMGVNLLSQYINLLTFVAHRLKKKEKNLNLKIIIKVLLIIVKLLIV